MEEAQHARLDTLMVEALAASMSQAEIEKAIGEYLEIGGFIDGGLRQQVEFDLDSFTRATGRTLSESERERATEAQVRANRYTYLVSGMTHPNFLATIESIHPAGRARIEEVAAALS
jgi:hypothetical protein